MVAGILAGWAVMVFVWLAGIELDLGEAWKHRRESAITAGLALACPGAEVIPVEPEGWDDVCQSLAAGEIRKVGRDAPPTACDALQTPGTWPINFAVLQDRCRLGLAVTPAEVRAAQRLAFARLHLVLEPGGAAALAAVLAGKAAADGTTLVVLSGGNTDAAAFAKVLESRN